MPRLSLRQTQPKSATEALESELRKGGKKGTVLFGAHSFDQDTIKRSVLSGAPGECQDNGKRGNEVFDGYFERQGCRGAW